MVKNDNIRITLTIRLTDELAGKIKKLAKLTGFNSSYVVREILNVSFKNGIARELFFLYIKDHSDPFLRSEILKDRDKALLLKDAFTAIEALFSEQESRINELEINHSQIVNEINGRKKLTDFI